MYVCVSVGTCVPQHMCVDQRDLTPVTRLVWLVLIVTLTPLNHRGSKAVSRSYYPDLLGLCAGLWGVVLVVLCDVAKTSPL